MSPELRTTKTKRPLRDLSPMAVEVGRSVARVVFKKRGNHTEVHLSETELAALFALAIEVSRGDM